MDLMQMSGKSIKLPIGGKEYELSPITINDLADLEKAVKEERLTTFLKHAGNKVISSEERQNIIQRILCAPFTSDDFLNEMQSMNGIRLLVFKSISKNHPEFKLTDTDKIEDIQQIMETIMSISNIGATSVVENPKIEGQD